MCSNECEKLLFTIEICVRKIRDRTPLKNEMLANPLQPMFDVEECFVSLHEVTIQVD